MPANRRRGEVEAVFDGRPHRLALTLGALAELEAAFAVSDLAALAERFESGRLSARDVTSILGAGLRGGGGDLPNAEVARLTHEDGAAGFVRAAADLLRAAFAGGEGGAAPQIPLGAPEAPSAATSAPAIPPFGAPPFPSPFPGTSFSPSASAG